MFVLALYDENDALINYSAVHSEVTSQETGVLIPQIRIPASIDGYTLKMYSCEGNDLRYGSMIPLSIPNAISSNNQASLQNDINYVGDTDTSLPHIILSESAEDEYNNDYPFDINLMSASYIDDVDVDVSISYNGIYCEKMLQEDSDVMFNVSITNNRTSAITLRPFSTIVNKNTGILTYSNSVSITIPAGETRTASSTTDTSQVNIDTEKFRFFLWGMSSGIEMQPAIDVIELTTNVEDFYGDSLENATLVEEDKGIIGTMDNSDDVDCFKFTPKETGSYLIYTEGDVDTKGALYDSDMSTLLFENDSSPISANERDTNFKIGSTLKGNNTYYLKITSQKKTTGDYELIIKRLPEPQTAFFDQQYYLLNKEYVGNDINVLPVWEYTKGEGVKIGIADGGIEPLNRNFNNISSRGWNCVDGNYVIEEKVGHGTAVSGVAAASYYESGIVGVAPESEIVPLIVLNKHPQYENGRYQDDDLIEAIEYASNNGIDILNISLQADNPFSETLRVAFLAVRYKMLLVVAAGNEGVNLTYDKWGPAGIQSSNVIVVANVDKNGELYSESNYGGRNVSVAAPGTDIISTEGVSDYYIYGGTSFSAPMVSGIAALLKSYYPNLTVKQLRDRIVSPDNVTYKEDLERKVSSRGIANAWLAFSNPQPNVADLAEDEEISVAQIRADILSTMLATDESYFSNQIIVAFEEDSDKSSIIDLISPNAEVVKELTLTNSVVLEFDSIQEAKSTVETYNSSDNVGVRYAEPNYYINLDAQTD